jgi:hypothetical protein
MAEDLIRYDILAQEALRSGVVRKVLSEVARTGLPGEHHFFISFVTKAPGVRLSQRLLEQYDKEMTIVLQNQFANLKVGDTGFEVDLSFDGRPETLGIPFSAIKGFFDPSVQFGLQFDVDRAPGEQLEQPAATTPGKTAPAPAAAAAPKPAEPKGEKIVSLDSFRKK